MRYTGKTSRVGKPFKRGGKSSVNNAKACYPPCANERCPQQKENAGGGCYYWSECPLFVGKIDESTMSTRGSKYGAKKVIFEGLSFDSKKERDRWCELQLLVRAGEITNLRRQVEFELIPAKREPDIIGKRGGRKPGKTIQRALKYRADFVYEDKIGNTIVEDVKGYKGGGAYAVFLIKKKLMREILGIEVQEI